MVELALSISPDGNHLKPLTTLAVIGPGSPDVSYWFYPDAIRRRDADHSDITDALKMNPPVTFYDVSSDEMSGEITFRGKVKMPLPAW